MFKRISTVIIISLMALILGLPKNAEASWAKAVAEFIERVFAHLQAPHVKPGTPNPHAAPAHSPPVPHPLPSGALDAIPTYFWTTSVRGIARPVSRMLGPSCQDLGKIEKDQEIGVDALTEVTIFSCGTLKCLPLGKMPPGSYVLRSAGVVETNGECWVEIVVTDDLHGFLMPGSAAISLLSETPKAQKSLHFGTGKP